MAALVFALLTLMHEAFAQGLSGDLYFFTAAISVDALFISIAVRLKLKSKLTMDMATVSFCFIVLNGISWVLWNGEFPQYVFIYETGAMALYCYAIIILLKGVLGWDGINDGNYQMAGWTDFFRFPDFQNVFQSAKIPPRGKR